MGNRICNAVSIHIDSFIILEAGYIQYILIAGTYRGDRGFPKQIICAGHSGILQFFNISRHTFSSGVIYIDRLANIAHLKLGKLSLRRMELQ